MFKVCMIIGFALLAIAIVVSVISTIREKKKDEELCKRDDYGIHDAALRYRHKHPVDK